MRRVTHRYQIFWSTTLSVLSDSEAVFCGNCNRKTTQTSSRVCSADTLLIEIMRVTGHEVDLVVGQKTLFLFPFLRKI